MDWLFTFLTSKAKILGGYRSTVISKFEGKICYDFLLLKWMNSIYMTPTHTFRLEPPDCRDVESPLIKLNISEYQPEQVLTNVSTGRAKGAPRAEAHP